MKLLKFGIRFWITLTSVVSFLAGWVLLAHAPKPDQSHAPGSGSNSPAPLPTLEPLGPRTSSRSDDDVQFQQPFFNAPQRPFFRTGGS